MAKPCEAIWANSILIPDGSTQAKADGAFDLSEDTSANLSGTHTPSNGHVTGRCTHGNARTRHKIHLERAENGNDYTYDGEFFDNESDIQNGRYKIRTHGKPFDESEDGIWQAAKGTDDFAEKNSRKGGSEVY